MAKIEESVWLNAKPEEVWPYIVEPEKKLQWLTELHEQEWLDERPAGVGTRFYVQKEIRGQVRRYDCVIERWEENRRFDFTAEPPASLACRPSGRSSRKARAADSPCGRR